MAIRIRVVEGKTVALCAVETDPASGDLYLDDSVHHALVTKFAQDYNLPIADPELIILMDKEKVRDAKNDLEEWLNGKTQNQTRPPFDKLRTGPTEQPAPISA